MNPRRSIAPVTGVVAGSSLFIALTARALRGDDPWIVLLMPAYAALLAAAWSVARRTGDFMNPLTLLILFGLIRFGVSGVLLLTGSEPPLPLYDLMALTPEDWQRGHGLALAGLIATLLGWLTGPKRVLRKGILSIDPAPAPSLLAWILGIASIIMFVRVNFASFTLALVSGAFRRAEIQEGTGSLFYLGLLAIPGSIFISAILITRGRRMLAAIPPTLTALTLFVLGGRARSLIPLVSFLLLVWYSKWQHGPSRLRVVGQVVGLGVALGMASWILYAGAMYRGGQLDTVSVVGWWSYVQEGVFVDIGHLGPIAAATRLGAGSMGPANFFASLLWPAAPSLGLYGRSPGVLMIEELAGYESSGGLLPSLAGDAYLNLGMVGTLIVTYLFGMWMKGLYAGFRGRAITAPAYVLLFAYSMRLYFETIERTYEIYLVTMYILILILAGRLTVGRAGFTRIAQAPGDVVG